MANTCMYICRSSYRVRNKHLHTIHACIVVGTIENPIMRFWVYLCIFSAIIVIGSTNQCSQCNTPPTQTPPICSQYTDVTCPVGCFAVVDHGVCVAYAPSPCDVADGELCPRDECFVDRINDNTCTKKGTRPTGSWGSSGTSTPDYGYERFGG